EISKSRRSREESEPGTVGAVPGSVHYRGNLVHLAGAALSGGTTLSVAHVSRRNHSIKEVRCRAPVGVDDFERLRGQREGFPVRPVDQVRAALAPPGAARRTPN